MGELITKLLGGRPMIDDVSQHTSSIRTKSVADADADFEETVTQ